MFSTRHATENENVYVLRYVMYKFSSLVIHNKKSLCEELSYNLNVCYERFHREDTEMTPSKTADRVNNAYLLSRGRKRFLSCFNTEMISCFKLGKRFVCCFKISDSISLVSRDSVSFVVSIWDSAFDVFPTRRGLIQRPSPCLSPSTIPARVY